MFFCPIYYVPYQEGDENIYLGIEETISLTENKELILDIFPNPASDYIELRCDLPKNTQIQGELLDSKGKVIDRISNQNFKSGLNSVKLDVEHLSSGTYFIRLQSNSLTLSESFVKK